MRHVTDKLQRWLAGELSATELAVLEDHLRRCGPCAEAADQERRLWYLLGEVAQGADQTMATGTTTSVWPRVRARTIGKGTKAHGLFGGLGLAAATSAVAAGLVLGFLAPTRYFQPQDQVILHSQSGFDVTGDQWLSDGSFLSDADSDGLDQVWLTAGLSATGGGS